MCNVKTALISDVSVAFTENLYNTSEHLGFVMVCTKIVSGTLGRSISVFASTIQETATGLTPVYETDKLGSSVRCFYMLGLYVHT